ncbi:hypothetical protein FA15DRAFT_674094 [Coprinopsis marcescibilis]|uniref:Uncharacterized protein n=1 Tax=Coprinopsis marcescibilis TaxID=230819 RepID=A0A5C3KIB8_COPMA|nr:hypothetical protein FA15DRAFT_674094 [Coprinopsis marcescibilis]
MNAMDKHFQSASGLVSPQALKLRALLFATIGLSVLIFALSMVHGGALSIFLAPVTGVFTLIFSITLGVLTHKDIVRLEKGGPRPDDSTRYLAISRIPSIVINFVLFILWLATLGVEASILTGLGYVHSAASSVSESTFSIGGKTSTSASSAPRASTGFEKAIGVGATETVFVGIQMGIMLAIPIMAILERRAMAPKPAAGIVHA